MWRAEPSPATSTTMRIMLRHAARPAPMQRALTPVLVLLMASAAWSTSAAAALPPNDALVPASIDSNDSLAPTPLPSDVDMCTLGSSGANTLLDYEYLVKCTRLQQSRGLAELLLVLMLAALLYLLSSTADSFFCPVLQAIVEKYRIPPDIAGVTFLSFGNGSPDVFSNIAAFTLATPNIGVASILGGGLLVTTVIVACVGLVSEGQEQLIPRKFIRDVTFYFVAVAYFCFVCVDGTVHLAEALGFLGIYACYALTVLFDKSLAALLYPVVGAPEREVDAFYGVEYIVSPHASERSYVSSSIESSSGSSPRETTLFMKPAYDVFRIRNYHTASGNGGGGSEASYDSDSSSLSAPLPTLQRKRSAPTPRSAPHDVLTPDALHRVALQPAHERQSLLERTDTYFKRPASVCLSSMRQSRKIRRRRTAWESVEASAHFGPTAQRWTRSYHQLSGIEEFPSSISETEGEDAPHLDEDAEAGQVVEDSGEEMAATWHARSLHAMRWTCSLLERVLWHPFEFVTTFVRRLTIPLVDEDTWDKNFAVACPPFIVLAIGVNVGQLDVHDPYFIGAIVLGGGLASAAVELTTSHEQPPSGHRLVPFVAVAFVMSVVWIMNIADELLGVLQALGELLGISNSVLGVSVLAWGNSIGDLVSNTSIARDGFPTMAFAGCFAGPMFNLLVGIGLALTIAVVRTGPVAMGSPTPLVYLGFGYLFASLALNLGLAALDDFQYRRRLCYALLVLYLSFAVLSIVVVLSYSESS